MYCPATRISVNLSHQVDPLWRQCHDLTHEMTMTKSGRRIFPSLQYEVKGLDPEKTYSMSMHLELVDSKKLKFAKDGYVATRMEMDPEPPRKVFHRLGSQAGSLWMANDLSFDYVRITNDRKNEEKNEEYIFLYGQYRYLPVLSIYENERPMFEARIPYTAFITVTNYHIAELATLKINNNPYSSAARVLHNVSSNGRALVRNARRWRATPKNDSELPELNLANNVSPVTSVDSANSILSTSSNSEAIPSTPTSSIFSDTLDLSNFQLFMSLLSHMGLDFSQHQLPSPISGLPSLAFTPTDSPGRTSEDT